MSGFNLSDEKDFDAVRQMFGPTEIDREIRRAIQICWMSLPKERRNVDEVERQIRRIFDRALRDAHEDFDNFFDMKHPK
jgi:hypothetical protein